MIQLVPWLLKFWGFALVPLRVLFAATKKNPLAVLLVLMLFWQGWFSRQQTNAFRDELKLRDRIIAAQSESINAQKTENAQMRQAIQKLTEAAAQLKPGETRIVYVDRPFMVQVPGQVIERQVPVVVTRTEKTLETRVETLRIPGEKITEFVEKSPQSVMATMTALRDIKQGEKFSATFVQLQPGVWQPLVTPDSPIGIEAKVITPIDRIPAPVSVPPRFTLTLYSGYAFGTTSSWITGVRADYRLSQQWEVEADAAHFWSTRTQEYRLVGIFRF